MTLCTAPHYLVPDVSSHLLLLLGCFPLRCLTVEKHRLEHPWRFIHNPSFIIILCFGDKDISAVTFPIQFFSHLGKSEPNISSLGTFCTVAQCVSKGQVKAIWKSANNMSLRDYRKYNGTIHN